MMKRQIFVLLGLFVFCLSLISASTALAKQYEVKRGDNLYTISKKFGVSVQSIKQINNLKGNALSLRQVLNIPEKGPSVPVVRSKSKPAAYYTIKKGDNPALIAQKTGVTLRQITALNKINPRHLRIGQKLSLTKELSPPQSDIAPDEDSLLDDNIDEDTAQSVEVTDLERNSQNNTEVLGKWNSDDERKLFVKVATGFLGAPYRLGGSTIRGIDCSAFVRKIYNFFDIELPRTAREQSHVGRNIDKAELVEGDLVFFRTRREFGHVGIYIGNHEFVHASSRDKVVRIDSLDTPYFHKRFVRAVRVKGLGNGGV